MNVRTGIISYAFLIAGIYIFFIPQSNVLMTVVGFSVLVLIVRLFYTTGNPNVLLLGMIGQWIVPMARVIYANYLGIPMREVMPGFYGVEEKFDQAFYLNILGVLVYGLGLFLAIGKNKEWKIDLSAISIPTINFLLKLYAFYWLFIFILEGLIFMIPGLGQLLVFFEPIRYGILLLILFRAINEKEKRVLIYIILAVEILFSFASYFSSFKDYIFVFMMVFFAFLISINFKKVVIAVTLAFIIGFAGFWWGAVKVPFREQYNSEIASDPIASLTLLNDIYTNLPEEDRRAGVERLIAGVGYIHFFSYVLAYVPENQSYEEGKIWLDAVLHTVTPRMFFPDKQIINDTEHLMKYTGLNIYSGRVSYSLGYIVDSYIDFGPVGMFIPIFLFAFFYRKNLPLCHKKQWKNHLVNYSECSIFFIVNINGKNALKAYSAVIFYLIIVAVLKRFVIPKLNSWIPA
jgi:hypothetical protein